MPAAQEPPVAATPQPIKRLGWNNLVLEPEHLSERLKDALQTMGATYELHICGDQEGEIFVLHAKIDQIACRVTVSEDPADGTQRISVTRLGGDTFEYHKAFRQLREHLGEACTLTRPLACMLNTREGAHSADAAEHRMVVRHQLAVGAPARVVCLVPERRAVRA